MNVSSEAWNLLVAQIREINSKVDILMDFRSKALGMILFGSVLGSGLVTGIITILKGGL